MSKDEKTTKEIDSIKSRLDYAMKQMQDLPLKKICPICSRYILTLSDILCEEKLWEFGWDRYYEGKRHFFICPVCAGSLKNNEPLRQKVWADLTKKAKKGE